MIQKIEQDIEVFKFREALQLWMEIARKGNKYLTETEPWKLQKSNPERVKTILNSALQVIVKLAITGIPFMPFTCEKIFKMLNIENQDWEKSKCDNILSANHKIGKPEILFNKMQ